ncbi:cadherin-related family member 4 [Nothoprocta perdicaria]|uniref:cadherin-related family member 4 n=1 Tax=Nothoprocta perdicaria TaxID=30464 RepID=UPI000E1B9B28|nr:cadherin-related family member 4 [Nothoprocta perdicaria]
MAGSSGSQCLIEESGTWLGAAGAGSFATALLGLPRTVTVSEAAAPGTAVADVPLLCGNASGDPRVTLARVEPGSPVDPNATALGPFNPAAVSTNNTLPAMFRAEVERGATGQCPGQPQAGGSAGSPRVARAPLSPVPLRQISLRAAAALDARRVNQYALTLRAACRGEEEAEGQLFVRVAPALRCATSFTSMEGDTVQVPADVAPWAPLYTVVPLQMAGELAFSPKNNDTPLVLTERGTVLAPAGGFEPTPSTQVFRLEIVVTDRHGHNCSGAVTVQVQPSRRPRVTFAESAQAVTVPEGTGPLEVVTRVHASGDSVRYVILTQATPALFTVDAGSGEIRSTCRLDLERFPQAAHTQLLVQAYEARAPAAAATMALNVTVRPRSRRAPRCVPALYVSQVPETVPPGRTLLVLRCVGPGALRYEVEATAAASRGLFRMEGPRLQVNATLDYDSELAAAVGFQFAASIVVTAEGQPPRSTRVPVLVTVTPVNEYAPQCPNGTAFSVPETAAFGTAVGRVAGTDRDYPPHSIEYGLEQSARSGQPFSIDAHTGRIYVVGPLDYGRQRSYRLAVRLTDTHNDADPAARRSCLCDVAVRVQAVLGEAPVCTPEVQELRITSRAGGRQPVTRLACQGGREGAALSYAIARGNEDGRFRMEGNTLLHVPNGLEQPRTFVLLVEAWADASRPRRSAVVMLVVHVTPQSTTAPPRSVARRSTARKEPLMVTRTEAAWSPAAWFVAALTASGALLLAALGCAARALLQR